MRKHYDIAEVRAACEQAAEFLRQYVDDVTEFGAQARLGLAAQVNLQVAMAEEINRCSASKTILEAFASFCANGLLTAASSVPDDGSVPNGVADRIELVLGAILRACLMELNQGDGVHGVTYDVKPMPGGRA